LARIAQEEIKELPYIIIIYLHIKSFNKKPFLPIQKHPTFAPVKQNTIFICHL
jgi:hypothetical protein